MYVYSYIWSEFFNIITNQTLTRKGTAMSQVRHRAILSILIWGIVAVGFVWSFFSGGGPASYTYEPSRILIGAGFLLFGFIAYYLSLWLTRVKTDTPLIRDERDEWIALRASRGALVFVLVSTLVFALGLWIVYRDAGFVPVGWMWFMGYCMAIIGYLSQAVASLIVEVEDNASIAE